MQVSALNQHKKQIFFAKTNINFKSESKELTLKKDEFVPSTKEKENSKKPWNTIVYALLAGVLIAEVIYEIVALRRERAIVERTNKAADEFEKFFDEIFIEYLDPIENQAKTLKEKSMKLVEKLKGSDAESSSLRKEIAEIMEKLTNSDIDSKLVKEENSKLIEEIKQLKDKIKTLVESQSSSAGTVEGKPEVVNVVVESTKEEVMQKAKETSKIDEMIEEVKILQEKQKKLQEENQKSESLRIKMEAYNQIHSKNTKGLASIAGYNPEKNFLFENVVVPIRTNEVEKIPNLVLMYGPKGTGKTTLLNSIVEDAECNSVSLHSLLDDKENLELLRKVAKQAIEDFKSSGKRTIIKIDEIETFLNVKDEKIAKEFSEIIDNLSQKYNSTIIGTTNYPKEMNSKFLNLSKVGTLYIPPIAKEDLPELIKFYTRNFQGEINYQELADIAISKLKDGNAYSNARIKNELHQLLKNKIGFLNNEEIKLLTQKDLVDVFKKLEPDLTKEVLDSYKNIF